MIEPSRMFKTRLDRNERNQPFSNGFMQKLRKKIDGELFMVYPEIEPIYKKVAKWLNIESNQLVFHAGADLAIKTVFETYINPGEQVLLHFPGFAMYEIYCKMFQATIVHQICDSNLDFDWDKYIDKVTKNIRMVVIENPNGFLGTIIPLNKLRVLVNKAYKNGVIVLVDEAYFHFHDGTAIKWIKEFDNLIVVRTFSKAFGLAGLRAGYLVSQVSNIGSLKQVKPTFELNSIASFLISELLDNLKEVKSYTTDTRKNLKSLRAGFAKLGIKTSDSRANFIAVKLGKQEIHDELREELRKHNILIRRPFRENHLREWVRISTAPPSIQSKLLETTEKILEKHRDKK